MMRCPGCGKENSDGWPLLIDKKIESGGCEQCFLADFEDKNPEITAAVKAIMDLEESLCRVQEYITQLKIRVTG